MVTGLEKDIGYLNPMNIHQTTADILLCVGGVSQG